MQTKNLNNKDLPQLSDSVKERINNGFWSLVETQDENGAMKLFVRTEEKIFELSSKGLITKISDLKEFNECITARLNFA